jgi:hypothetical protein
MSKALMQEAIDKEDWERMDKGQKPRPKVRRKVVEPEPAVVKDRIRMDQISLDNVSGLDAKRQNARNSDGVLFIGFNVTIGIKGKTPLTGWMTEGDFYTLKREIEGRVDTSKVEF